MSSSYRRNKKIVKYQKTHFNIGSIAFFLILLYIIIVSFSYFTKEQLSIYEVTEKQMSDDNMVVGFAIREETVYNAQTSGTIAFYNNKSKKVSKESPIYSIDSTGAISNYFSDNSSGKEPEQSEIDNIRNIIHNYKSDYDNADYNSVEDFKYSIESSMLSFMSDAALKKIINEINKDGNNGTIQTANESGIITYWTDGYENIKIEEMSSQYFDTSKYQKNSIKSSDNVNTGSSVCKVITNEEWNIIVNLTGEQYAKLENKNQVRIRFASDNLEVTTSFELFTSNNEYFANLKLNKYLSRYLDDRYINIELLLNSVDGLKIPQSSILEKNCYKVPVSFISKGGAKNRDQLVYENYDNNGNMFLDNIDTFCMKDEEYVYLDTDLIKPGTVFVKSDTNETFKIAEMQALKGVYNVNEGYSVFKYIDILYENQEYCIIDKNTPYGLSVYDHIVINPDLINENDIIY